MSKKNNKQDRNGNTIIATNKKAKFEYHFVDTFEAGIMLRGTEIKAIREGNVNLSDAYCYFLKPNELYIKSLYIGEYKWGGLHNNHVARRERKLLLRKKELKKLNRRVTEKGLTIISYQVYITERGFAKVLIALGQGKKVYDKRETLKDRDSKRDLDRMKKMYK